MENNFYQISKYEAIALIIIIMINKLILNIPYYIIDLVGSGAIVNIIYIGIIDFIVTLIIVKLLKRFENSDILDISEFLGGKILKTLIGIISIALFLIVSFITIVDFSNVLHIIYFSDFPIIYILFFFIIGILIVNFVGFKSIIRTICFVTPFAIISVIVAFFTIWSDLDINNLTPILGQSYHQNFIVGLSNTFSMYIIVYFYFIKPLLKDSTGYKKIAIISYIISFILLLLTVISMLTLFNTTSSSEPINSLFLLSRQLELGTFIQRIDALFILLWIFSIFSYLSFVVFLINRIIKKLTNISNEKMLTFPICSILIGLTLIPINVSQIHFIESTLYKYLVLGFMFGISLVILILANFKKAKQ